MNKANRLNDLKAEYRKHIKFARSWGSCVGGARQLAASAIDEFTYEIIVIDALKSINSCHHSKENLKRIKQVTDLTLARPSLRDLKNDTVYREGLPFFSFIPFLKKNKELKAKSLRAARNFLHAINLRSRLIDELNEEGEQS